MNALFVSLIIAVVQGIAEWLPISSSAQVELFSKILSFQSSLVFDVVLQFGTLMAVFVYFSRDIIDIIESLLRGQFTSENGKLGVLLIIASIPALVFGLFLHRFFESSVDNLLLMSFGFAITGVVLLIGSLDLKTREKKLMEINYRDALLIGFAQAFSLFRGISRSGTTITSGLILGLSEKSAIKFSFLLSIPVIMGASVLEIGINSLPSNMFWAALVSFLVGIVSIHFSFTYILNNRKNLRWLALYVFLLAIGIWLYLII